MASSAAPRRDASTPSFEGTIRTSRRGAASARRSSSASTMSDTNGWIRPNSPPKTTSLGSRTLTRPAKPDPDPAAGLLERVEGVRRPSLGVGEERRDGRSAAGGWSTCPPEETLGTGLGLPASDRSAAAWSPHRVDRHVADFTAIAGRSRERPAVDDDPAPDADLARQEQDIVGSDGRTAPRLSERAEVCLVGNLDRHVGAERLRDRVAKTDVCPAEVRRRRNDAVQLADDADDRDSDPDLAVGRAVGGSKCRRQSGENADDLVDRGRFPRPIDPCLVEDVATETDDRGCQRVDFDIEGKHRRGRGDGRHERRGPSWRSSAGRAALGDEAARDKLTDEAADSAARQSCPGHQLRAGEGAASMELTDDQAEVRAANRLASMPEVVLLNRHRNLCPSLPNGCARLLQGVDPVSRRLRGWQ